MIRYRKAFFIVGCAIVIGALLFTDPDSGISTAMLLLTMVTPLLAVADNGVQYQLLGSIPGRTTTSTVANERHIGQ